MEQIFDAIRQDTPELLEKLIALEGDVTLPTFGLSPRDLQLVIDHVSVVFNSAATVRFDEELKTAIEMNVKGPRRLLEICRQMKHLEVIIKPFILHAHAHTYLYVKKKKKHPS